MSANCRPRYLRGQKEPFFPEPNCHPAKPSAAAFAVRRRLARPRKRALTPAVMASNNKNRGRGSAGLVGQDAAADALLPAGLADVLAPQAAFEAATTERLMRVFSSFGYARVEPPLIEFESTLLAGPGQALASQMFRLMDPGSQRMMGLRTDITLQVARIARSRLKDDARPLRLSYAGEVLRVSGAQLRPERQFAQAGVELIGSDDAGADREIVLLAAEAMTALGISDFSVDLTHPLLVPAVARAKGLDVRAAAAARLALDRKDAAELAKVAGPAAGLLGALLRCSGPAGPALKDLLALDLPEPAGAMARDLDRLVGALQSARSDLTLTVDPCEFRGFEYHTGISFSVFSPHVRGELAGGGRYRVGANATDDGEPATGLTLYMESIMRGMAPANHGLVIFVPFGVSYADANRLRAQNWVAVQGLVKVADPAVEAKRLGCTHWFEIGRAHV